MHEQLDIDEQLAVAGVYAEALFALAAERDEVDLVRDELEELSALVERERAFAEFMRSAAIDPEDRAASLRRMFAEKVNQAVLHTLLVMNKHGRTGLLWALARSFNLRRQAALNQVETVVTSAVELSAEQRDEVTALAREKSGKEPLVRFEVDESLLGGLVVQVGDWRYDASLRRKLGLVREQLLERSDRGLAEIGAVVD